MDDAGGVSPASAPGDDAAVHPGTVGTVDAAPVSTADAAGPPAFDGSGTSTPDDSSVPPDAIVLDPEAGDDASTDPCDLDRDGHRATSPECGGDDCCDYDGRAYPGEQSYFANADACGSFDYDCNGTLEEEYGTASCALGFFKCSGEGFDKAAPPCGVNGTFDSCNFAVVTCSQAQAPRAQSCR